MRLLFALLALAICTGQPAHGGERALTVAVASNLKDVMHELVAEFRKGHANADIEIVPGSSGKLAQQIVHGAPYDLYFSADMEYPQHLVTQGLARSETRVYARGRLALWSTSRDVRRLSLTALADPGIGRVAIANPKVAPYGRLAQQALQRAGAWQAVQSRLVYGENVAQALQFAERGAADVAVIPLSLVQAGRLEQRGSYAPIPDSFCAPLDQGYVLLKRSAGNPLAVSFADFIASPTARPIFTAYGYLPSTAAP